MWRSRSVVVVGLSVGLVCSVLQAVGLALQKKAVVSTMGMLVPGQAVKPLYKNRVWLLGLSTFVFCNVLGYLVAVSTLPLIILSLLQSCSLLFNALVSRYILGGKFFLTTVVPSLSIVIGVVLVGLNGGTSELTYGLDELITGSGAFVRWFYTSNVCVILLLLVCYVLVAKPFFKGICFGIASGTLSAHLLLVVKCIVMIVEHSIWKESRDDVTRVGFFTLFLVLAILGVSEICIFNYALRYLKPTILYPLIICIYSIISVLNGYLMFMKGSSSDSNIWVLISGVTFLVAGVICLSYDQYHHTIALSSEINLEPNRTTVLSYASLRPLSMDSTTSLTNETLLDLRNPVVLEENEGETSYVSFHQRTDSDYGATNSKRNRLLSFEQEELLAQLA